jgi:hypothetical protein
MKVTNVTLLEGLIISFLEVSMFRSLTTLLSQYDAALHTEPCTSVQKFQLTFSTDVTVP